VAPGQDSDAELERQRAEIENAFRHDKQGRLDG